MRRLGIPFSPLYRYLLAHRSENHHFFSMEAALSADFDALFGKLSSQDLLKYARRNNVESEVKLWNQFLRKMKYVLDDAEERQMSEGPIKIWLDDLRDLAYDVEDILDEFSYQVLRQKVMAETEASTSKVRKLINAFRSYFSPRGIKFNESLGLKMKEITQRFEAITKEKENLNLTERATGAITKEKEDFNLIEWATRGSKGVVTTSLVQESQIYGREKDKKTLVNELLSGDSNGNPVSVVAIVGMGGLGKTTLAQLLYNDETVSRSFDIKAWVYVSDAFDVFKITVEIIESFTSSTCDMKDLNNVQKKLKDVIHGKKFLLILDDVWNENYLGWDALRQPLAAGRLGSKVLITTRSENVAAAASAVFMHRLKKLELEECLSLLALHAFGVNTFSGQASLQEVGEHIAKKCDGLPLVAKALGRLLRGKNEPRDWQTILNSNMWEFSRDQCPIVPALRVSYHYLPSHLKRCFAFCAIFPKDYEFDKDDLILWWMAEGLLEQSKLVLTNFTEAGNEYFNDLLSRSFFQPSTGHSKGNKFVMHDLMNDLATWVSGETSLHLNNYEGSNYCMKLENLRHLSFMSGRYDVANRFEKFSISMRLRTFIGFNQYVGSSYLSSFILERVMPNMRCLKLLCLRGYAVKELPQSISELKHLRHLDMSVTGIQLLPESICGLLNLQVLKLNCCCNLVRLPRQIRKLINLQVLDISETDKLETMPPGIGRLKNLQILSKLIIGENHELRLKELERLSLIRGELSIWGLEKVVDVQEAKDANLKAKKGLDELQFKWKAATSGVENENQVQILLELQPHTTLRSLEIDGYNGKDFPKWVGDCRFINLETLYLRGCNSASSLPPLGGMSSLKMLNIKGMHEVKKVGKEFFGNKSNSNQTFPLLETLILKEMNRLEEWCSCFGSGEETEVIFPRLRTMEIRNCPVLVGRLPNLLPLLEELKIFGCPNLRNLKCTHNSLQKLVVEDCSEAAVKTLGDLTSLGSLRLKNIKDLICMDDELLSMLGALQEFEIERCGELKNLVRNDREIEGMVGLKRLKIVGCDEVVSLGQMRFNCLRELTIEECPNLEVFVGQELARELERLEIRGCEKVIEGLFAGGLSPLVSLTHLIIDGKNRVLNIKQEAPVFLPKLQNLSMANFGNMDNLAAAFKLPSSVEEISIEKCSKLREVPMHEFSSNLKSLRISDCPLLKKRCLDRKGEYWPLLSMIPHVDIDSQEIYLIRSYS